MALQWCADPARGGPTPPMPPMLLHYFDNDISEVTGEDLLIAVKLRESGASTRIVATCCHTTLAVDHWAYLLRGMNLSHIYQKQR